MKDEKSQLVLAVKDINLEQSKVENLLSSFGTYFDEAKKIASEAKSIVVTEESQTELMNNARKIRLDLKNIRVSVEKTRIELKNINSPEINQRKGNIISRTKGGITKN